MQPGTRIYLKQECQNWTLYQIPLTVLRRDETFLGIAYLTKMDEGTHVYCWASSYFAIQKKLAVKKTPWKDLPCFTTPEEELEFRNANLLERS